MGSDWRIMSLREAHVELIDCDHRTPPPAPTGYPYISIPDLRDGRIDVSRARRITAEHFREWTRRAKPQAHDVILSRRTNPGVTASVPSDLKFALGQNLVLLRTDGSVVDPRFLRWLVRGPDWWAQIQRHLNVGAVFDSLKCADIPDFRLRIPPLSEQRRIAELLTALDDKIDLNRRTCETLESMARAVFKSWFIDFDPVRAKAAGRDPGLPSHVADMFPDSFEDSELGEIPAGWRQGRLGDVLKQRIERCEPSADTESRPYVPIECISSGTLALGDARPGEDAKSSLIKFARSDLLFGAMRPYFHKVCIAPFDGTTRTTVFVLRPRRDGDFAFGTLWLHRRETIDYATQHSTGSTIPYAVCRGSLEDMLGVLPPPMVRDAFDVVARPLLGQLQEPYFQNKALTATRDTLLPALLSGTPE